MNFCTHRKRAIAAALGLALLVGCNGERAGDGAGASSSAAGASDGEPLARVGDRVITTADVERRLAELSPYERARYNSEQHKRRLIDNMIRVEVLAAEARARGFDEHPEVVRTVNELMIREMMEDHLTEVVDPDAITEDELRAFFDERKGEFRRPEKVRASAVVVTDAELAEEIAAEATGASSRQFRDLVEAHSQDPTSRERGGDLHYFAREDDEIPQPVTEAAFELEAGEVAGPIDSGDGTYFVLVRTGHRPAVKREFDDVRRRVRTELYRQRRAEAQEALLAELREGAEIEIHEQALTDIEIPAAAARAGDGDSAPGARDDDPGSAAESPNVRPEQRP